MKMEKELIEKRKREKAYVRTYVTVTYLMLGGPSLGDDIFLKKKSNGCK